jgi:hypothetical protein
MGKTYLGDGVYVEMDDLDPLSVVLTTSNGMEDTNRIVLEPEVLDKLNRYIQQWFREHTAKRNLET